jgi:hypothetical protein
MCCLPLIFMLFNMANKLLTNVMQFHRSKFVVVVNNTNVLKRPV